MISTAQDLVTFLSAMLEGRLFSEDGVAKAMDWRPSLRGEEYGMGLFRIEYDGYTTVAHDGLLPGGGPEMRYIPEFDVYIGAVTNTDRDILSDAPILTERVMQALLNEG